MSELQKVESDLAKLKDERMKLSFRHRNITSKIHRSTHHGEAARLRNDAISLFTELLNVSERIKTLEL